jgi:hypothetical protein
MTINATATTLSYDGNGSTTAFPVSFQFFGTATTAELKVIEVTITTGAEVLKTNGSDYTVSGGNGSTGTVTASTAPASGKRWVIIRNTTNSQNVDYVENDAFPAEIHERTVDRLTALVQEIATILDKVLKTPEGFVGTFNGNIPTPIAGRGLQFNSAGDGLEITEESIANIISTATTLKNDTETLKNTTETYKDSALSSLNGIQIISLGAKSSAPTVDNNGNALVAGTLYYDTTATLAKIYNGTAWQNIAGLVTSASDLTTGLLPLARLADGSIITVKLADDSVTQDKIANNSVGTDELINNSVTTAIIADDAVTKAKLEQGSYLPTHIFTDTTGKFFTRNTDGSLPTGITAANVWSLTDQAGGGVMIFTNHIELPLKVSGILAGGGGGGSTYYGASDGGDTIFLGITAEGGNGGRGVGGSGYSNLIDTLVNNSTVKSFPLNNRGGSSNNSSQGFVDTQGVFGYPGSQVFFIATLPAGTVYDYVVGASGNGGGNYGSWGSGASGENGFITINY